MTWDSGYSEDFSSFSKKDIDPLSLLHDHALGTHPSLDVSVLSDDELLDVLKTTKDPRWIQPWMGTTLSARQLSLHEVGEHGLSSEMQTYLPAEKHVWDPDSPISQHSSTSSFSQSSTHSSIPSTGRILSLDSVPFSGGNISFHNYNSSTDGSSGLRDSSGEYARASAAAGESMPSSFATTNSTAFSRADDQDSLTTMCSSHDGGSSIFSTSHGSGHAAASGACRCAFHAKAFGAATAGAEQRDAQNTQYTQQTQQTQYTQPTQYTQSTQFSQIPQHHASQKAP